MNYACHHELFLKKATNFYPPKGSLCATFIKDPVGPQLGRRPFVVVVVVVTNFFPGLFFNVFVIFQYLPLVC